MAESEDRTLAASERRLERAREDGQAPLSREVVMAAGLVAGALALTMAGPGAARDLVGRLAQMLVVPLAPQEALAQAGWTLLAAVAPLAAAVGLVGAAAVLLQTQGLLHLGAAAPDLARLDPRRGLSKVFGVANLGTAGAALVKLAVLGAAAWSVLGSLAPDLARSTLWSPGMLAGTLFHGLVRLVLLVLGLHGAWAVLDLIWTRMKFARRMRMSREEQKQEQREAEGDPKLKARLRQLRTARARRRMLASVAKATVVITNPTHYAVALAYERGGRAAPRVVAKGMDDVAARIRAAAQRAGVPLVANPALARALHAVPLDAEVPAEHFRVVAEVIAYVWRLRGVASR